MWKKLAGYIPISFASFCFFTIIFHTIVKASTNMTHNPAPTHQTITHTPTHVSPTITPSQTQTPTPSPIPTVTPTSTPTPQPTIAVVSDLESLFSKYAAMYHIDKELLKKIARCESGFNTNAINNIYTGMFQFAERTWISVRNAMGLDSNPDLRKNAEEAIKTSAYMLSRGQQNAWPNCK